MDIIQIIIQAGAVGVAVYVVYAWKQSSAKKDDMIKELVGNHMNHNTEVLRELSKTLSGLKQIIGDKLGNGQK
ncbi:MAG TPA: hypothetical protein ENI23_16990 [bacterium]|nr:hypothetical protein [bacterium]